MLILRAFQIADGSVAANIFPTLEGRLLDSPDLVAGIPSVQVVHDIFQNDQHLVILVNSVHSVIQGNEAAAEAGKYNIRIFSAFDVVPPQTGEVLTQHQVNLPRCGVRDHLIEPGAVERRC